MRVLMTLILFFALAPGAQAQDWFIFPNDGQDQEQQDIDEFQCIRISRDRTGFDPMATPTATTRAPETQGGAVGGGARCWAPPWARSAVTPDADCAQVRPPFGSLRWNLAINRVRVKNGSQVSTLTPFIGNHRFRSV